MVCFVRQRLRFPSARVVAERLAAVLLLTALIGACGGSPQSGTQTGDEGDVAKPGVTCTGGCASAQTCCVKTCVTLDNDLKNCGACGKACQSGQYCKSNQCLPIPCSASCGGGAECCGSACCGAAELCCDPGGDAGPQCSAPALGNLCPAPR
ncbi:MAG TPA: hypothetical protein VGI10_21680 [Polyangiaceae bacterium]